MAAIEDPGAIAVGGELEGCEDPFANFESYLYMCMPLICMPLICL